MVFDGNDGKKNLSYPVRIALPELLVRKLLPLACIDAGPVVLLPDQLSVMALSMKSITILKVSSFKGKEEEAPIWSMYCRTTCTSQVDLYLGRGV